MPASPDYSCGTLTQRSGQPVVANATLRGYTCPAQQGQQCIAPLDNPEYGFNGFDNYGEALLYMMQARHAVHAAVASALVGARAVQQPALWGKSTMWDMNMTDARALCLTLPDQSMRCRRCPLRAGRPRCGT